MSWTLEGHFLSLRGADLFEGDEEVSPAAAVTLIYTLSLDLFLLPEQVKGQRSK